MSDEPFHRHFLFDLQEEAVAAQHHALQDVQGHLLDGGVGGLGVDVAGNLGEEPADGVREGGGEGSRRHRGKRAKEERREIEHLLDEDGREVLPGDDAVVHQLHEGRQRVGHDHVAPETHPACSFTHTW